MIVAGLGCRKGSTREELLSALDAACTEAGISRSSIAALATGDIKREEPGILQLAETLGLPLHIVNDDALMDAEPRTKTVSRHSLAKTLSSSLSEAAALAVAGERSEIIVPRLISKGATCALAEMKEPA
ncbi:cobalamin biosynthesis protein [Aliirhizobium smilacinae]|uniref:Cobalamin biosynthesis protein n=1 Tax=Aliirhizobium smilacinae TaxID=1395944 RepID=A0A5C4XCV1_9HYPH|nr:cobalamin biosynthesis protein [Rhizobium smilacinae]TNM60510.1 cobalamin biosynthesis protein [Rhizobium smilacinae]